MELAQKYGLAFIEASALSGKNVNKAFKILTESKLIFHFNNLTIRYGPESLSKELNKIINWRQTSRY